MSMLTEMGKQAKEAAVVLSVLPTPRKNKALSCGRCFAGSKG